MAETNSQPELIDNILEHDVLLGKYLLLTHVPRFRRCFGSHLTRVSVLL
jgi:hypothetical protein